MSLEHFGGLFSGRSYGWWPWTWWEVSPGLLRKTLCYLCLRKLSNQGFLIVSLFFTLYIGNFFTNILLHLNIRTAFKSIAFKSRHIYCIQGTSSSDLHQSFLKTFIWKACSEWEDAVAAVNERILSTQPFSYNMVEIYQI